MTSFVAVDKKLFRRVRLYHWLKYLQKNKELNVLSQNHRKYNLVKASATFHLKTVQALNDLFPVEDTAEKDASGFDAHIEQEQKK